MSDLLVTFVLLAQDDPGRGDDPDGGIGVLIIVGIVLALFVGGLVLHALFHRFGRSRPESGTRTPAPPGRVGRTSEFREDG